MRSPERAAERQAEAAALKAWRQWLKVAPDWWMAARYAALGCPWNNPRLTAAAKYKVRLAHDEAFALAERVRWRAKSAKRKRYDRAVRKGLADSQALRKPSPVLAELGYDGQILKQHIERQFSRGMTWEKLKAGQIHIDHIVPLKEFDLRDPDQERAAWALTNLRPMWAAENIAKGGERSLLL